LLAAGYHFMVLPDVFVVDISQPKKWKTSFNFNNAHKLFEQFRKETERKYNFTYSEATLVDYLNSLSYNQDEK